MWNQFFLQNTHFALSLFASLVFFAVFWLYFDAWQVKKTFKEGIKLTGFLCICLSFLALAATVESTALITTPGVASFLLQVQYVLRGIGYVLIFVPLLGEKLVPKPKDSQETQIASAFLCFLRVFGLGHICVELALRFSCYLSLRYFHLPLF